ncbi:MAG: 3-dehydroquinate synthase [Myxococcota bacterium]
MMVHPQGRPPYPIQIEDGGLERLGAAVTQALPSANRVIVVTNPVVGPLYADAAAQSLTAAGLAVETLTIPDGEDQKTLDTWRALVEALLAVGIDRRTPVAALGGGVTGDIVGFAAASVMRGVPLVQIPTTLLAMVDSAVGGKTAVNTPRGKNLVGAFHQPRLVFSAMGTLQTLDPAELRGGLGEVVKHGVLGDVELFEICQARADEIARLAPGVMRRLVDGCCRVKADIVAEDTRERGRRALLNLGHTVGHAIELVAGLGTLRHGACVGLGMIAEARWAAARGACAPAVPGLIAAVLGGLGLPTAPPVLPVDALIASANADKKRVGDQIATAVEEAIGQVRLETVPVTEISAMMSMLYSSEMQS